MKSKLLKDRIVLENKISKKIFYDNRNTVHFNYTPYEKDVYLHVYTYNSLTEQIFLLYKCIEITDIHCLENVLAHIDDIHKTHSYTVIWKNINVEPIIENKSYFQAENEDEVRYKIHHMNENIEIISINLNPIS